MEDNTQAVQALSKKDEAYVRIKDRIISGEYKPGSLLVERTLSDSLNMSRTPIRPYGPVPHGPCHLCPRQGHLCVCHRTQGH